MTATEALLAVSALHAGFQLVVSVVVYPEARHEVFNETNRAEVVAEVLAWLDGRLATVR